MVIASSIDKDAWKEVVNEFLRTELASGNNDNHKPTTDGREWLRVAYSLFSGQGAAAGKSFYAHYMVYLISPHYFSRRTETAKPIVKGNGRLASACSCAVSYHANVSTLPGRGCGCGHFFGVVI